jgi:hypothetical protein
MQWLARVRRSRYEVRSKTHEDVRLELVACGQSGELALPVAVDPAGVPPVSRSAPIDVAGRADRWTHMMNQGNKLKMTAVVRPSEVPVLSAGASVGRPSRERGGATYSAAIR